MISRAESLATSPLKPMLPTHGKPTQFGQSTLALAPGSAVYRDMWAIVFPDGHIVTGSDLQSEADAWRIALGWPGPDEIEHAKRQGTFAVKSRLRYFQPNVADQTPRAKPEGCL